MDHLLSKREHPGTLHRETRRKVEQERKLDHADKVLVMYSVQTTRCAPENYQCLHI